MTTAGLNLLVPEKRDPERDSVAEAFARRGGVVHRLDRFWEPPQLDSKSVRVYGPDSFCLVLQQRLGFPLCSPDDELLLQLANSHLLRRVERKTLRELTPDCFPSFIKPVVPKQFRGAVYTSAELLEVECRGLPADTSVFISEPVRFAAEARSFVLGGQVLDTALYEGEADLKGTVAFVKDVIHHMPLPRTVVIDVGFIVDRGWVVVEFNAAWGAGLNGCSADKVIPAIIAASAPDRDSNN